jgi:hypothetical protein
MCVEGRQRRLGKMAIQGKSTAMMYQTEERIPTY